MKEIVPPSVQIIGSDADMPMPYTISSMHDFIKDISTMKIIAIEDRIVNDIDNRYHHCKIFWLEDRGYAVFNNNNIYIIGKTTTRKSNKKTKQDDCYATEIVDYGIAKGYRDLKL